LRRPRSGSGPRSVGSAVGQAPDRARFPARHAVMVPAIFPPEVALSAPHDADAHWRVTPQVPCRWPPSDGCPGSKPQPPPSRFAAAADVCSNNRRENSPPDCFLTLLISNSAATFFGLR
jgi:hypothetical protein